MLPGQILQWLKVKKVPIESSDKAVMARHFVSNNGLYDVWVMWNTKGEPVTSTFTFREGYQPVRCREVNTGAAIPVDHRRQGRETAAPRLRSLANPRIPQSPRPDRTGACRLVRVAAELVERRRPIPVRRCRPIGRNSASI